MRLEKTCENCDNGYISYYEKSRFCSNKCKSDKEGLKEMTCPVCNCKFNPTWHGQIHCDKECYSKSEKLKEEARNSKLMELSKGNSWRIGKTHTEESKSLIRDNTPRRYGEDNPEWKGDEVGYKSLHDWVKRHKEGFGICEVCGFESDNRRKIHCANISGDYKRDINDYAWLCVSCHKKFDLLKLSGRYEVIGVECKISGKLDKPEKEKCQWYLDNNVFSKILIVSKHKIKNRVHIEYSEFNATPREKSAAQ